ncbi:hypothetical protein VLK31_34690 [Variovorax sp. H27-G14]|uniref:hypothetical protein n=1 Tax=Variovorax sp. H27-G14 TaxID=3111914 RepID=UPI0038FD18AB
MKASIVIDRWKLPIFTRRLKATSFSYEEVGPLTADTLTLIVLTENAQALAQVVLAANKEAAQTKARK